MEELEEKEKVIEIEIERLRDFKKHPFQVRDDKEMSLLKEMNFAGSSWTAESTGFPRKVLTTGWINSLLKNNFPMEKVHRHSNAIFIFPLFFQQEGRIDYE